MHAQTRDSAITVRISPVSGTGSCSEDYAEAGLVSRTANESINREIPLNIRLIPTKVPTTQTAEPGAFQVKSDLQDSLEEKKHRQDQRKREHTQKRVHQHINSSDPIGYSEKHLPKESADAVRLKGKD